MTKTKTDRLSSFRIKNFKAIRDSQVVKLGDLTALIGNNGSGKSSLVEGLQTFKTLISSGIDAAFQLWRGIENIRYKGAANRYTKSEQDELKSMQSIEFQLKGNVEGRGFTCSSKINESGGMNDLFFESEYYQRGDLVLERERDEFRRFVNKEKQNGVRIFPMSHSMLSAELGDTVRRWQFLTMEPSAMGQPTPQTRYRDRIELAPNGSNIAEYLLEIRSENAEDFQGIIESLKFVLPYASDLQPTISSELGRSVYFQLSESDFKIPGWLLSTGSLRIIAILACLRHPTPPPLLVIEEIENGLDPRTLHLVVEEIRAAIALRRTQVIVTTHSPYLLDLLDLSHVVIVERMGGQPVFTRPDSNELGEWATKFSPGKLYTMGRLSRNGQ